MSIDINGIKFNSKDSLLLLNKLRKYWKPNFLTEISANRNLSENGASIHSIYDNINPVAEIEKDRSYYICFDAEKIDDLNNQINTPYKKEIFKFKTDNNSEIERFSVLDVTRKTLILDLERTGQSKWSKAGSATPTVIKKFDDSISDGYLIENTKYVSNQNGQDTFEVNLIKIDK